METKILVFKSKNEFLTWKSTEEEASRSNYCLKHTCSKKNGVCYSYYECNRSGNPKVLENSKRKRTLKLHGSRKIGYGCSAKMIVKSEFNGKHIEVKYVSAHTHEKELQHLSISKKDRTMLAEHMKMGVGFDTILNAIRDSLPSSDVTRKHLIRKKDLFNIAQCFNIKKNQRCATADPISIELLVVEERDEMEIFNEQTDRHQQNVSISNNENCDLAFEIADTLEKNPYTTTTTTADRTKEKFSFINQYMANGNSEIPEDLIQYLDMVADNIISRISSYSGPSGSRANTNCVNKTWKMQRPRKYETEEKKRLAIKKPTDSQMNEVKRFLKNNKRNDSIMYIHNGFDHNY